MRVFFGLSVCWFCFFSYINADYFSLRRYFYYGSIEGWRVLKLMAYFTKLAERYHLKKITKSTRNLNLFKWLILIFSLISSKIASSTELLSPKKITQEENLENQNKSISHSNILRYFKALLRFTLFFFYLVKINFTLIYLNTLHKIFILLDVIKKIKK